MPERQDDSSSKRQAALQFRAAGTRRSASLPLLEWLPSGHGLQASYVVLREWAGLIVARMQD